MALDLQRQRVYDAETVLAHALDRANLHPSRSFDFFGSKLTLPEERRFGTLENVQDYIDKVLALPWVRDRWGVCTISTRTHGSLNHGFHKWGVISLPVRTTFALRETYVLHEMAHHFTPQDVGHGPQFVGALHLMLTEIVGPEAGLIFSWACAENGVKLAVETA